MVNAGNYPAFPCEAQGDRSVPREHDYLQNGIYSGKFPGLMIRDWFAAQALPAVLAELYRVAAKTGPVECGVAKPVASMAYKLADAMLAAREIKPAAPDEQPMQHVAYFDEGQFHWMSGIAPRDCELYAKAREQGK